MVVNPYLFKKLPFDIQKDLAPVGLLASAPILILANPHAPITSLGTLIQRMQEKKTQLSYAIRHGTRAGGGQHAGATHGARA